MLLGLVFFSSFLFLLLYSLSSFLFISFFLKKKLYCPTAPEVLEGEDITPESALYSYGVILWEILTRQVPYENEHPIKVVTKILAGHRPLIPREKIPQECVQVYLFSILLVPLFPRFSFLSLILFFPLLQILEGCWNREIDMRPSWHVIQTELSAAIEKLH
jgi:hypothetical protein